MKRSNRSGFTIIEVIIAIIMLSVGVLALASSSGTITRMISYGQARTDASALAQSVLDSLRYKANNTTPKCTAVPNGTTVTGTSRRGFTSITDVTTTADLRNIVVTVYYRVGTTAKSETVTSSIFCL